MLQVVPKWRVELTFSDRKVELWIYDQSPSNVLRKLADLQFSANGLDQPSQIQIQRAG